MNHHNYRNTLTTTTYIALKTVGVIKARAIKDELAETIQLCVQETSQSFFMNDMGIKPGPVKVINKDQLYVPPNADITAIIGFKGHISGGAHFSAPIHVGASLASALMGETVNEGDESLDDAIGELANIVAGSIKDKLSEDIQLTPPVIVRGGSKGIEYSDSLECTTCYFKSISGPFFVEVFYQNPGERLVMELKKEHELILQSFNLVKTLGIHTKDGLSEYRNIENLLMEHIIKEDNNMYPVLNEVAKSNKTIQAALDHLTKDLEEIDYTIHQFSQTLTGKENLEELESTFNVIGDVLINRIKLEEALIYPAFEKHY